MYAKVNCQELRLTEGVVLQCHTPLQLIAGVSPWLFLSSLDEYLFFIVHVPLIVVADIWAMKKMS